MVVERSVGGLETRQSANSADNGRDGCVTRRNPSSQDTPCSSRPLLFSIRGQSVGRAWVFFLLREREREDIYDTRRPMTLLRTADPTMDHSTRGWTIPMLTAFHAKCREPRSALYTYEGIFRSLLVIPWAG